MVRSNLVNIKDFQDERFDETTVPGHNEEKQDGGGPTMPNDYVTHKELDSAVDKLSSKMDLTEAHIDTKFETVNTKLAKQELSITIRIIAVVSLAVAIIGLMIKFL